MDYNEINKSVGKSKIAKIFGWIFLVFSVLAFAIILSNYVNWKLKEENYDKQYAYSNYGNLYYEMNNNKIYIEKIYDTNDEIIELKVPDKKTVIMYCSKNNIDECIYFDMNDIYDQMILNPFIAIIGILILLAVGLYFVINAWTWKAKKDVQEKEKTSLSSVYVGCVLFFVLGAGVLVLQMYNIINYFNLKNENNVTIATIYSEIYKTNKDNEKYTPVSYYYVDNQKYIYMLMNILMDV